MARFAVRSCMGALSTVSIVPSVASPPGSGRATRARRSPLQTRRALLEGLQAPWLNRGYRPPREEQFGDVSAGTHDGTQSHGARRRRSHSTAFSGSVASGWARRPRIGQDRIRTLMRGHSDGGALAAVVTRLTANTMFAFNVTGTGSHVGRRVGVRLPLHETRLLADNERCSRNRS